MSVTLSVVEELGEFSTRIEFSSNGTWSATVARRPGKTTVIPTAIVRYWWPARGPEGACLLLRTRDAIYRLPVTSMALAAISVELTKRLGDKGYPAIRQTPR